MNRALLFSLVLVTTCLRATDLDLIMGRYYEAMGGEARLRQVSSLKTSGVLHLKDLKVPFTFMAKEGKYRLELTIQGTHAIKIFDGEQGWEINPLLNNGEPKTLTPQGITQMTGLWEMLGYNLVDWRKKGYRLTFHEKKMVDEREVYPIQVKTPEGVEHVLYIDAETHLLSMYLESTARRNADQMLARITEIGEQDGLKFVQRYTMGKDHTCDHSVHRKHDKCGYYKEVVVSEMAINPALPESLFIAASE